MPSTDEYVAAVSERGRVTIPRELRIDLGLDDADAVRFCRTDDGEVCLRPVESEADDGDAGGSDDAGHPDDAEEATRRLQERPSEESSAAIRK